MLFNGVLRPKLFNILFASCFLIILIFFLLPHIAQFDNVIALSLLVFETLGFIFSVFFYTLNAKIALFYILYFKMLLITSLRLITSSMPIFLSSSIRLIFSVSLHHSNAFF